jgi:hypothetical protein
VGKKTPPLRTELALELDGEVNRAGCQRLLIAGLHRPADNHTLKQLMSFMRILPISDPGFSQTRLFRRNGLVV